jgi:hypothetical protein
MVVSYVYIHFLKRKLGSFPFFFMELAHSNFDGKQISFPLIYYVDGLLVKTHLIRWSTIFLQQLCFALDHCHTTIHWRKPSDLDQSCLFFFLEVFYHWTEISLWPPS